jgi:DNA-binding response OmpR family regulator
MATSTRILVVDDDPDLLETLAQVLRDAGYDVEPVASGQAAIDVAGQGGFDLALTDLMMPGLDGAATVAALKRVDPTLAILVGTAFASLETAVECMKLGADDYLRKPYDLAELGRVVGRALDRRRMRLELESTRRRLAVAEGLATVGRLAAALAHELNNPLTFVHGNLVILKEVGRASAALWRTIAEAAEVLAGAEDGDERRLAERLLEPEPGRGQTGELLGEIAPVVADGLDGVRRIRELIEGFAKLASGPGRPESFAISEAVDEALVGLGARGTILRERALGDRARAHGDRGDHVAALHNLCGALLERQGTPADQPVLRLSEDVSAGPRLLIVAPKLTMTERQRAALFDIGLQADLRAQRMRFDLRLVIARELLARQGAEVLASAGADGGTILTVRFQAPPAS